MGTSFHSTLPRPDQEEETALPPGERLARIEARLDSIEKHGATKTDIERLRGWILGGVIAAFVIALGVGYLAPPD